MARLAWIVLTGTMVVTVVVLLIWLGRRPADLPDVPFETAEPPGPSLTALRIGLIPERDIFAQRKRYRALADYLGRELGRTVELATLNTYEGVLKDFEEKRLDGAFLGSMVAVLAMDRLGAHVLVKPETDGDISTYRGVIFVPADSPVQKIEDLSGRSLAMVRTTTAGNLFPVDVMVQRSMLRGDRLPKFTWVGTHDDVIMEVMSGHVDAGAVKNLRLDAYEQAHPDSELRRLATSEAVPNNALLLRHGVDGLSVQLQRILLNMDKDEEGRAVLKTFGALRFLPCAAEEYAAIYDMVERLGDSWALVGVTGPAPRRPESLMRRQDGEN